MLLVASLLLVAMPFAPSHVKSDCMSTREKGLAFISRIAMFFTKAFVLAYSPQGQLKLNKFQCKVRLSKPVVLFCIPMLFFFKSALALCKA